MTDNHIKTNRKSIFKDASNISAQFSKLWAEVINQLEQVNYAHNNYAHYNESIQSCPHQNQDIQNQDIQYQMIEVGNK